MGNHNHRSMEGRQDRELPSFIFNKMEQQIANTEWKTEEGKCTIVVTLTGDMEEGDIMQQAMYTIKGLGFGDVTEEDDDGLEQH